MHMIAKGHTSDPFNIYTLPSSEPSGLECGGLQGELLTFHWQRPLLEGKYLTQYNFHYRWTQGEKFKYTDLNWEEIQDGTQPPPTTAASASAAPPPPPPATSPTTTTTATTPIAVEKIVYYFHLGYKTFDDAKKFCEHEGSKLVEPKNQIVNNAIIEAATSRGLNDFWIGVRYKSDATKDSDCDSDECDCNNDKFKFVYANENKVALKTTCDDEDDPDFLFWSEKEPSCGKGDECESFCVQGGVEWKSSICDQEKHFICEYAPTADGKK